MDPRAWARFRTRPDAEASADAGALLEAGARVGPWQVLELLGTGGMARVYLARRADGEFEQRVALKVVRGDEALAARLRHERALIASLRHPHIVSLVDGGETREGAIWLAMALVEGDAVDAYVRARDLDWRARLRLFDAVCGAVEYAHGRALIHRDIKPANILVDREGHPRLLDFGIAVEQGEGTASDRALTPGYAAPEQIAGQPLTTATDIFQLGLVLRAMLAGDAAPAVPPAVRRDLDALVARATAFDPERRHPTVAALREDLAALLARRPLAQDAGSIRLRWARFAERHRLPLAVAGLALLALLAGLLLAALRLRDERDRALASEQRAQAIAQFLVDTLAQANPWGAREGGGSVLDAMDRAAARLDGVLAQSADVRRGLREAIGNVYTMIDEPRRCLALLGSDTAQQELAAAPPLQHAKLLVMRSECHLALDDREPALELLEAAEAALAGATGREADALRAWILVDQGQLLSLNGKLDAANPLFERALVLATAAAAREQEYRANRMLGYNLQAANDQPAAADRLGRALAIATEVFGPTHRSALTTAGNLALSLGRLERWEEAQAVLRDALAAAESIRQRDAAPGIVIAQLRDNLATLHFQRGELAECVREARAAFELYRQLTPDTSSQGFNPSWRVASCAYQAGDLALAGEYATLARHYAGNGVPVGVINAERMLAAVAARSGDIDRARTHLARADAAIAATEAANPTVHSALRLTRALVAIRGGDAASARRHLAEAEAGIAQSGANPAWLQQEREQVAAMLEAKASR